MRRRRDLLDEEAVEVVRPLVADRRTPLLLQLEAITAEEWRPEAERAAARRVAAIVRRAAGVWRLLAEAAE